ncbi:AsmA family protein [[Empedobacter] haloabium]|uniref:AsmA family protein n=1 Tax=[Empedobacter] haloabium TaxID=592317 RepID=A0ABZ1UR36_9BURK
MTMPRRTKIALAVGGTVVAIPAIALVVLLNYDWNKARPWLNAKTSEAIERPFAIRGDLSLTWEKQPRAPQDRSWRDWIPWPHLVARDVHLGNPTAMVGKDGVPADMASVDAVSFSLNPFALLHQTISIPELAFRSPSVYLRRTADGSNNWTFEKKEKKSKWELDLDRVVFSKGSIRFVDGVEHIDATAQVDTLDNDRKYGVGWKLSGQWNDAPISGTGKTGAVLSLQDASVPFPILADAKIGLVSVAAEGTLVNPAKLAGIDMNLKVSGASMARLYPITGLVLPETPPFSTHGHLVGQLAKGNSKWTYDNFVGKVGSSDIGGKLAYQQKKPRGHLTGTVHSKLLQFADLGPLIGADSNEKKKERGVEAVQPADKVLPVEKFRTERWTSIDADVSFKADRITRTAQLPISKLYTEFHLNDGVLKLTPLNFDFAGGSMASTVKLDGSGKQVKDAIAANLDVKGRHIKIKELFPNVEQIKQATVGEINAEARLSATGNSVATLLAASNGEVKATVSQGTISKMLLEQMGLNVGSIVVTKLVGDKPVQMNCLAGDFAVTNGVAQTRSFIVDTTDATLHINGAVSLADEKMDLTLKPDSKGLRIVSLRSPIYVRGSFKQPDVAIDKGVLAMRAGGAIALATLAAPVAAVIPLIHGGGGGVDCAKLLAQSTAKPSAPPPGKQLPASKRPTAEQVKGK